jgi:transitional endoplasmic reticulum ATPase
MQKANWDDVILKQEFKDALQKDVYGFFKNEKIYKELAIPWKVTPLLTWTIHLTELNPM